MGGACLACWTRRPDGTVVPVPLVGKIGEVPFWYCIISTSSHFVGIDVCWKQEAHSHMDLDLDLVLGLGLLLARACV